MILEVNIKKKLKEFDLEVSFSHKQGCLGILGASGSGKSMTLKSIAGIVKPDEGRIAEKDPDKVFFDSSEKIDLRPQKRKVGYLFQNYALFPNMTVKKNIMSGLNKSTGQRITKAQKGDIAEKMLHHFGLEGVGDRFPAQLSGGQQQRVALARILAYEPRVLLLDEPFSAMDTFLRERLRLELGGILRQYEGISILVTHDRDEAYELCDSLLLMDQGQVIARGSTRDIFDDPGSVQAARLTGCKNISRIEKLGPRKVRALDWGDLELTMQDPLRDEISAIGIRAHNFERVSDEEALAFQSREDANLIKVEDPRIIEYPFEWYVTLKNGLWWKIAKNIDSHDPHYILCNWLKIDSAAIMQLRQ